MENIFIKKSTEITDDIMAKINSYSRKTLSREEVYVFSVILCDNEIDRDNERFPLPSLEELAKLFVGKTGIFDHSMRGADQTARVFECAVEISDTQKNSLGEPYARLRAEAYMPRIAKNEALICEIEAGIKKEVSIGCSVRKKACSVCGRDKSDRKCDHVKGTVYKGIRCFTELLDPSDAYEWSFVAVPAQPMAGVTKSFKKTGDSKMENIEKTLSGEGMEELRKYVTELEKDAGYGRQFRASEQENVLRMFTRRSENISAQIVEGILKKLSMEELSELKKLFDRDNHIPSEPQLCTATGILSENNEFLI